MPSGCALPYGITRADRTGAMGLLREFLPMGECEVRQQSSEKMSTWQMRSLRWGLTIRTQGPGISPPKLLPDPYLMYLYLWPRFGAYPRRESGGHLLSLSLRPLRVIFIIGARDIPTSY